MGSLKDKIRSLVPKSVLKWNRQRKKNVVNKQLESQKSAGKFWTTQTLIEQLQNIGIQYGDHVLVHSSMSKIGYLENGPKTFVDALLETVGDLGTVLMPSSPNAQLQLDFIRQNRVFDVRNSPSRLGAITEYFRNLPHARRSLNATEPVVAVGAEADFFTDGHFGELTPYTSASPFSRLAEKGGKILYVGVTLANAGTSLHVLEDAVDFHFPVYFPEIFDVEIIDYLGVKHLVKSKVHNPEMSVRRRCDELLPHFENAGVAKKVQIGQAETWLFDAKKMLDWMIRSYQEKGVTMYTPNGKE
jgi:aminoglycoside 3-N-acetyltransferase